MRTIALLLLLAAPVAAQTLSPNFQFAFTPLDGVTTKAHVLVNGAEATPVIDAMTSVACGANRCVTAAVTVSPATTVKFKLQVWNSVGASAVSNEVSFPVPANPVAPTLSVSVP